MESIQITGNKSEFKNFISDPIVLEPDSKICLNKASFAIPVWTQKYITVPALTQAPTDERAYTMFTVIINGVSVNITWREFYTAWLAENVLEGTLENVSEDDFFDGTYIFNVNNFVNYFNDAGEKRQRVNFLRALAEAINTEMEFFKIEVNNKSFVKQEGINLDSLFDPLDKININADQYSAYPTNVEMKNLALTCTYNPEEVFKRTPTQVNDAAKITFFNSRLQGDDIDFNYAGAGAGSPEAYAIFKSTGDPGYSISPNGGYWRFRIDLSNEPSNIVCGLMFMDKETKFTPGTSDVAYNDILVGYDFSQAPAGFESYRIFDGISRDNTGDFDNNAYPISEMYEFDDDVDLFAIQVVRAGEPHPNAYKYIVNFYQGDINDFGGDMDKMDIIYSSNFIINNPAVDIVPIITCSQTGGSAAGGVKVRDNHIVERTDQDVAIGKIQNLDDSNLFKIEPGILAPVTFDEYLGSRGIDFFNSLGFFTDDPVQVSLSEGRDPLTKTLIQPLGACEKRYFIGINKITDIYLSPSPEFFLNEDNESRYIPRQIEISMMNTSQTPGVGSFIEGGVQYTENDINKVVSYINTDPSYFNSDDNIHLEYVYEAFNLVFRKLYNRDNLPLNSFNIKIGYKDFFNNIEKKINTMIGVVKLEFLFDKIR
jgi:hypothetical protein